MATPQKPASKKRQPQGASRQCRAVTTPSVQTARKAAEWEELARQKEAEREQ